MSKFVHTLYSSLMPAFNMTYEFFQTKDIEVHSGPHTTGTIGTILKEANIKRLLIVTDKIITKLGLTDEMCKSLEKANIKYFIYDEITPDPTSDIVEKGVEVILKNNCDAVLSFGGGSVIDSAKVLCGLGKNPTLKKYFGLSRMLSFSRKKGTLPLFSVPTTAGTGAEVTMGAVISDAATHEKGLVIDKGFIAKHIFLDPCLTTGLPPHVTTATTFDALTHAIESYISKISSKTSRKNSIEAIKDIFKYLPITYKNPQDLEARERLLIASNKAGLAIGRAHIGTVHSIGHNAGAQCKIPHGLIIGALLPHVLKAYLPKCEKKLANLSVELGFSTKDETPIKAAKIFIDRVETLAKQVHFPKKIDALDKNKFNSIVKKAEKESYLYPIPTYISKATMLEILEKISD